MRMEEEDLKNARKNGLKNGPKNGGLLKPSTAIRSTLGADWNSIIVRAMKINNQIERFHLKNGQIYAIQKECQTRSSRLPVCRFGQFAQSEPTSLERLFLPTHRSAG